MLTNDTEYIPISDVPRYIPGRRVHRATVWRWSLSGLRRNGKVVKLSTRLIGGRRYTTRVDIDRFLAECNDETAKSTADESVTRRADSAGRMLESRGVL